MSNFAETMSADPPRLVVMFQRGHDGSEQFQWGVVGQMPILSLIGGIARAQISLADGGWMPECDDDAKAFVIAWNKDERELSHFLHPEIPVEPLIGMLETIKAMLVGSRLGQHNAAQKVELLRPDGTPWRS